MKLAPVVTCGALSILLCLPTSASAAEPRTREEVIAFMGQLTDYVTAHHMRTDDSQFRGMLYEFYDDVFSGLIGVADGKTG
jgi:hypothetical protein